MLVEFCKLGNFSNCKNAFDKASKAMFGLIQTARKTDLPIHVTVDLSEEKKWLNRYFYTDVTGYEIWGYENLAIIDKLQVNIL